MSFLDQVRAVFTHIPGVWNFEDVHGEGAYIKAIRDDGFGVSLWLSNGYGKKAASVEVSPILPQDGTGIATRWIDAVAHGTPMPKAKFAFSRLGNADKAIASQIKGIVDAPVCIHAASLARGRAEKRAEYLKFGMETSEIVVIASGGDWTERVRNEVTRNYGVSGHGPYSSAYKTSGPQVELTLRNLSADEYRTMLAAYKAMKANAG